MKHIIELQETGFSSSQKVNTVTNQETNLHESTIFTTFLKTPKYNFYWCRMLSPNQTVALSNNWTPTIRDPFI